MPWYLAMLLSFLSPLLHVLDSGAVEEGGRGREKRSYVQDRTSYAASRHGQPSVSQLHPLSMHVCTKPAAPMRSIAGSYTIDMRFAQPMGPIVGC